MSVTSVYIAEMEKRKQDRLEKIALAILAGAVANTNRVSEESVIVYGAISMAKEFIKQIDAENADQGV